MVFIFLLNCVKLIMTDFEKINRSVVKWNKMLSEKGLPPAD